MRHSIFNEVKCLFFKSLAQKLSYSQLSNKDIIFPQIPLTITTCKRSDAFCKTINSLFANCLDIHLINKVIIIDDNSTLDQIELYKTTVKNLTDAPIEIYHRHHFNTGHFYSIHKLLSLPYDKVFAIEDDWEFLVKADYIKPAQYIMAKNNTHSCGFRNFICAEGDGDAQYFSKDYPEFDYLNIDTDKTGWPGFSLNPSILDIGWIRDNVGDIANIPNFERRFAEKCRNAGFKCGFFPNRVKHIYGPSAYSLNCSKR